MHRSRNILRTTRRALLAAVLGGLSLIGAHGAAAKTSAAPTWLTFNAKAHTASLTVVAGYTGALGGFNFNWM
jgi:hypothetical protein